MRTIKTICILLAFFAATSGCASRAHREREREAERNLDIAVANLRVVADNFERYEKKK